MEILQFCLTILNMVLYYSLLMVEMIFNAFGLTWLGVVTGLAVISVLLRLFAANLVGAAVRIHDQRAAANRNAGVPRDRGTKAATLSRKDYSFSANNSVVRDHFINKIRKG